MQPSPGGFNSKAAASPLAARHVTSLMARKKARAWRADWRLTGALIAALLGSGLPISGLLQRMDWIARDTHMQLAAQVRATRTASDVVLIALDESTLTTVPEPLALLHPHLGDALSALADAGARAVAIDLVLPERSFDQIAPGYDARLQHGILAMRQVGVVVLARTVDEAGRPRPIYPGFLAAAGDQGSGFALLQVDDDGVVRRFDEHLGLDDATVPTLVGVLARRLGAEAGRGLIDFSRRVSWTTIPLHQVLAWARAGEKDQLAKVFGGKVVLLGSTLNLVDLHRVPVGPDGRPGLVSGMFVHAQSLQDVRANSLLREAPDWVVAVLGALCGLAWATAATAPRALLTLSLAGAGMLGLATALLTTGFVLPLASLWVVMIASALTRLLGESIVEIGQKRHLRRLFAGYVSPNVLAELEAGRLEGLRSARCFICVLFVDIRGFTTRAETDTPEQVTATLNQLFERVTELVHRHGGTVKEFMGDGVMAFFGAPAAMENPVRPAFDAARAILNAMPEVNDALARIAQAPVEIGMGMACGEAVVGHIGAANRHNYGAVGDCVNLASRLEGLSKELGYSLIVSSEVASWLGDEAGMVALGRHTIKGHSAVEIRAWTTSKQGQRQPRSLAE